MEKLLCSLKIAFVFIGTVVGAGLASGQEITQFFSIYGYKSFFGILICLVIYISMSFFIINTSLKYKLNSYDGFISIVSPGMFGTIINSITTFFLIGSSAIILSGSGALIHQYFKVSRWIGIIIMIFIAVFVLLKGTEGLIKINSIIVPSLIVIIVAIFILYITFYKQINLSEIKSVTAIKSNWILSAFIYGGFNIICCSGVLVPLSKEIKDKHCLLAGTILGSLGLTLLVVIINFLLILNIPYIFKYEIPLLYIANRFGKLVQLLLLLIIWLEMLSTEISNIYSVGKNFEEIFNLSYKRAVILIILITIPVSCIGFIKLISFLYPAFGVISLIFILQCLIFRIKNKH
ncbi:putative membrane protein YkvI [Clostridium algifaecis]|uniref:Membrane protein YkvI n=1 Tax=Clostridium algifaecis TaxID=1472040 RepID=A0ABS4KVB6_9CLOT|nr:transporter [Clostridium algifaecis]MBP2033953.1 putative membrane protein YkvI [Clostridium algifaecis]